MQALFAAGSEDGGVGIGINRGEFVPKLFFLCERRMVRRGPGRGRERRGEKTGVGWEGGGGNGRGAGT